MTSSVEIFDVKTLTHVDTHSFGIAQHGSLTWLDQKDGYWYIGFAHYAGKESSEGRDVRWTSLVKYDLEWRQVEAWVFPKNLVDLFTPKSNSGGAWGADGLLYCTGHDRAEVYVLKLPKSGYTLQHMSTLPAPIEGQGIAIDRSVAGENVAVRHSAQQAHCYCFRNPITQCIDEALFPLSVLPFSDDVPATGICTGYGGLVAVSRLKH